MVSTRLTSPTAPMGFDAPDGRHRVDPVKLLDLIHRIKTASGARPASLTAPKDKPIVKAG